MSGTVLPGAAAPGTVNIETAPAMQVNVTLSSAATDTDVLTLTVREELGSQRVTAIESGIQGGGVVAFDPIDVRSLDDGILLLSLSLANAAGTTTFDIPSVLKDTVAPTAPLRAEVVEVPGSGNGSVPGGTINLLNQATARLEVEFSDASSASDEIVLTFSDGMASRTSSFSGIVGAGTVDSAPVNFTTLSDGPLTASGVVTDRANNAVLFDVDDLFKDTLLARPTMAVLAEGADNLTGIVNQFSVGGAVVSGLFPEESLDTDQARVVISDGTNQVVSQIINPQGGQNGLLFPAVDLSTLDDGALTLVVIVEDAAGNFAEFSGTTGVKDTTLGSATDTRVAAGTDNAQNVINASSAAAVLVRVELASVLVGDRLRLTITDGVDTIELDRSAPVGPAATTIGPISAAALADGPIEVLVEIHDPAGNRRAANTLVVTKDTLVPTLPVLLVVPMGAANPAGFVNASSQMNARVVVQLGPGMDADRSVFLRVFDSVGMELLRDQAAPTANQVLSFTGLDLGTFQEGALGLEAVARDGSGNESAVVTGSAVLDRSIVGPTGAVIPAGPDNDLNDVSAATAAAVTMRLSFPVGTGAGDTVMLELTDGAATLQLPVEVAPAGGTDLVLGFIDTTPLADGTLGLSGTVRDVAGNSVAFGPFAFSKDTASPGAPIGAHVATGVDNDIDTINAATAGAVQLEVELPDSYDGTEQVRVRLEEPGGAGLATAQLAAPAGGGLLMFGPLNVLALGDGMLSMTVEVVDTSQNTASYAGTSPLKDTLLPSAPLSAGVQAGVANAADTINGDSQDAVRVQVDLPTDYLGDERVSVLLDDGVNPSVLSQIQAAPVGGGPLTFMGLNASGLADGPIAVVARLVDGAGNSVDVTGTAATKDVVAPLVQDVAVPPTLSSAFNSVSGFNVDAVTVELVWGANITGQETAQVRFTDGIDVVESAAFSTTQTSVSGFDLSSLLDGELELSVVARDAAGNETDFVGGAVRKAASRLAPRFAFVANAGDDTLSALQIDESEKWLRLAEYEMTGDEPVALAVDYDARFVFVANRAGNSLSGFRVDPVDGALEPLGDTAVGSEPSTLAFHPSGDYLFVASRGANEVATFRVDPNLGSLTQVSTGVAGGSPDRLAIDPSGRFLYVADVGGNEIWTYQVDVASGGLSLGVALPVLNTPTGIDVHPSGRYLFVGTSSSVTPFEIHPTTGALAAMTSVAVPSGEIQLVVRPDGEYLYSVAAGTSQLTRFRITAGALTPLSSISLSGLPSGIAVDAPGRLLYVTSAQESELQVFDLDPSNGAPTLRQRQRTRLGAVDLAIAGDVRGVLLSPRFLYAVDVGSESVMSYTIDQLSGDLGVNGVATAVGAEPQSLAIHAGAGLAFVANEGTGDVTRLRLDLLTGEPTAIGSQGVGNASYGCILDASRRFLYVSNGLDDNLSMFAVDAATGMLASVGTPVTSGSSPGWMAADPTGQFVYVVNRGDGTVGSYRIDPLGGALAPTPVPTIASGGMDPARIAVHPSGRFVCVTNGSSNSVSVFAIDALTGNLVSVGQPTATSASPGPIAIDPTGQYALVGNRGSGDISVYEISPVTGAFFLVPGSPFAVGSALGSLSVDPTGQFIHVSEPSVNRISVFALNRSTGGLSLVSSQTAAGQPGDLGATGSTQ